MYTNYNKCYIRIQVFAKHVPLRKTWPNNIGKCCVNQILYMHSVIMDYGDL